MGMWSWKTTAGIALGLSAGAVMGPMKVAGATTTTDVLAPGQVVAASPASALAVPVDGRVRGDGVDATVTGVAWPASVRAGGHLEVAGRGDRLVVFSLRVSETVRTPTQGTALPLATAALDAAGDVVSVPLSGIDTEMKSGQLSTGTRAGTAEATFAASVPVGAHDVDLVMTRTGFSQRFDLWTLKRPSPGPTALYRYATGSYFVTASSKGAAHIPATAPTGFSNPVALSFGLTSLVGFADAPSTAPPLKATQAYLDVQLSGTSTGTVSNPSGGPGGHFEFTPLPGDRLTFAPRGESPVDATMVPATGGTKFEGSIFNSDDGLFDAYYYFVVPAQTVAGTLSVQGGPITARICTPAECQPTTPSVTLSTVAVPITFPDPPAALARQQKPPWIGAPPPPTGAAAAGEAGGTSDGSFLPGTATPSGSGGFPVWLAIVLVLVVAGAAIAVERFLRRRRPVRSAPPTTRTPTNAASVDPGRPTGQQSTEHEEDGDPAGVAIPPTILHMADPSAATAPPIAPTGVEVTPSIAPTAPPCVPTTPSITPTVLRGASRPDYVPPLGAEGDLVVRVLGHIEITGWRPPGERRTVLESQCAYLALHKERTRSTEELLVELEPFADDRSEGANKTLRNNLSRLRQAVGADHLPDAVASGGYRLERVVTDWGRFCDLVAKGQRAGGDEGDAYLAESLAHVRGVPFAGAPTGAYTWALDTGLAASMTGAVADAAHLLAEHRLGSGEPAGAIDAARSGQRASANDFGLWHDLFLGTKALGDPGALARLFTEARRVIGERLARALFEGKTPFAA